MENLKSTLHKLDYKIFTLVEDAIENPYDSKKIALEANAIQNRVKRYRKYKRWTNYTMGIVSFAFLLTIFLSIEYLEETGFYDFLWLGIMLLLTYPFHYIFNIKLEKLQTALYLKKLKAHLEEIIQEPLLQTNNSNDTPDKATSFFEPYAE